MLCTSRHHCRTIFGSLFLAAAIQLTAVGPIMAGPTGGTYDDGAATKFLWVESRISPPAGHEAGEDGLTTLGLTLGTNSDPVNAAELATVEFSQYTTIAVASSFSGLLTLAELDGLISRSPDIAPLSMRVVD